MRAHTTPSYAHQASEVDYPHIQRISRGDVDLTRQTLELLGWGRTSPDTTSPVPRVADVVAYSQNECLARVRVMLAAAGAAPGWRYEAARQVCVSDVVCEGDSQTSQCMIPLL